MTGFSDLLFVIEESKKIKNKVVNKNFLLKSFIKHRENDSVIKQIQQKVKLKFNSEPSKSTILNGDLSQKNDRVLLYLKVPKVSGEVIVSFDSNFNIINVER